MVTRKSAPAGPADAVPPLRDGERLTVEEFERRYEAMPELKKAELIEGVVYVGSPVNQRDHGRPQSIMVTWAGTYSVATPGVDVGDNATVRLGRSNEPQPDVLLRVDVQSGRSRLSARGYVEGPPE